MLFTVLLVGQVCGWRLIFVGATVGSIVALVATNVDGGSGGSIGCRDGCRGAVEREIVV